MNDTERTEFYAVIGAATIDSPPWVLLCENRSDAEALAAADPDAIQVQPVRPLDRATALRELEVLGAEPEGTL